VIIRAGLEIKDAILASHFIDQYCINQLCTTGKVENWVAILDFKNLSLNSLPKNWIKEFISEFSKNYYQRTKCSFMLNGGFAVKMMWNIFKIFVDPVTKSKLTIESGNTCNVLKQLIHPKQLQKKYGGQAEDITVFWPPYLP